MSSDEVKGWLGFDRTLTRLDLLLGVVVACGGALIAGTSYAATLTNRIANLEAKQADTAKQFETQQEEIKQINKEQQAQLRRIEIALARISEKVGVEVE